MNMTANTEEGAITIKKFRGCLLGALVGDCLGAPFEEDGTVSKKILQKYFDKMDDPNFKSPIKKYTDDTAMTKSVAESLIKNVAFVEKDMAKRFVSEYFKEPRRGYGGSVVDIFNKLKASKLEDIWLPAREQFSGLGSFGNGAAMRVSPIGLFCCNNKPLLIDLATKTSKLTHSNVLGINGANLQALAVQQSFHMDPKSPVNVSEFISNLLEEMAKLEGAEDAVRVPDENQVAYQEQLKQMAELLKKGDVPNEEVVKVLGNNVLALYSVPTAIYSFLRAQEVVPFIQTEDKFRRIIQYSISLGGDTDTIASMAGAIAGAHLGVEAINQNLLKQCEGVEFVSQLAYELHSVTFNA
uniref:ADP-ribosylhydrolase ARH3 n=1 Tax=Rhodnius neglectus TaxID=72488 RepID=A0A0P4VID6_9HEMI